jgi:hypothetical protein
MDRLRAVTGSELKGGRSVRAERPQIRSAGVEPPRGLEQSWFESSLLSLCFDRSQVEQGEYEERSTGCTLT